MVGQKMAPFNS